MWRIPLLLVPAALGMLWIRRREALEGVTRFGELTAGQKAWILLQALPPGPSASLIGRLSSEVRRGYLLEGAWLQGSGQNLLAGVLREFCAHLPGDWTQGAGRDPEQSLALVVRLAGSRGAELAERLVALWPPTVPPAEPSASPAEGPMPSAVAALMVSQVVPEDQADRADPASVPAEDAAQVQAGGLPPEAEQER